MLTLVFIIIIIALLFDFVNWMSDAWNSVATIISTRVLSPRLAVLWAAFFNFAAILLFSVPVAKTIWKWIIDINIVSWWLILSALLWAIIWIYFFCARFWIPTSSSHSLIWWLIWAWIAKVWFDAIIIWNWFEFIHTKLFLTILFIFLSPTFWMILWYFIMVLIIRMTRKSNPNKISNISKFWQLFSSALFSLWHWWNDAQKTMWIIAMLLYSVKDNPFISTYLYPYNDLSVPIWVMISAHLFIALWTFFWWMKIIETMWIKITHLKPIWWFSAELSWSTMLFISTHLWIPVSTTHTIAGSIMWVWATKRFSAVRWGLAWRIVITWIITIPASAFLSLLIYILLNYLWIN